MPNFHVKRNIRYTEIGVNWPRRISDRPDEQKPLAGREGIMREDPAGPLDQSGRVRIGRVGKGPWISYGFEQRPIISDPEALIKARTPTAAPDRRTGCESAIQALRRDRQQYLDLVALYLVGIGSKLRSAAGFRRPLVVCSSQYLWHSAKLVVAWLRHRWATR